MDPEYRLVQDLKRDAELRETRRSLEELSKHTTELVDENMALKEALRDSTRLLAESRPAVMSKAYQQVALNRVLLAD